MKKKTRKKSAPRSRKVAPTPAKESPPASNNCVGLFNMGVTPGNWGRGLRVGTPELMTGEQYTRALETIVAFRLQ